MDYVRFVTIIISLCYKADLGLLVELPKFSSVNFNLSPMTIQSAIMALFLRYLSNASLYQSFYFQFLSAYKFLHLRAVPTGLDDSNNKSICPNFGLRFISSHAWKIAVEQKGHFIVVPLNILIPSFWF